MKKLKIEWRHFETGGQTCERCGDTGAALRRVIDELERTEGVTIEYQETHLLASSIAQSNMVLFNGVPGTALLRAMNRDSMGKFLMGNQMAVWSLFVEFVAQFPPLGEDVFLADKAGAAVEFLACGIVENLGGDHPHPVLGALGPVFPDIDELDLHPPIIFLFQLIQNRRHHLAGDAFIRTQIDQPRQPSAPAVPAQNNKKTTNGAIRAANARIIINLLIRVFRTAAAAESVRV